VSSVGPFHDDYLCKFLLAYAKGMRHVYWVVCDSMLSIYVDNYVLAAVNEFHSLQLKYRRHPLDADNVLLSHFVSCIPLVLTLSIHISVYPYKNELAIVILILRIIMA
jgi:hypothetical protein